MTQLSPQPDTDFNEGAVSITDSVIYRSSQFRVRDAGNFGWWPVTWSTSSPPPRGGVTIQGASEVGSVGIFDTSIVTYDGGIIHGKVDIYMEGALLITTSGNTDWTIGGVPAVYWPLSNTFLMERGKEHIISGTMETPGVVRTFRAQDYTDGFGLVGIVILPV